MNKVPRCPFTMTTLAENQQTNHGARWSVINVQELLLSTVRSNAAERREAGDAKIAAREG